MTKDEQQLAELLHQAVPEPRRSIDLSQIVPKQAWRPRTTWLPAITAACVVVLLCVTVYLISRPDSRVGSPTGPAAHPSTSTPTPTASPTTSPSTAWQAQQLATLNHPSLVLVLGGYLYRQDGSGFSRIDPHTGNTLASYHGNIAWPPVYADSKVWAAVPSSDGYQLVELSAGSLNELGGLGGGSSNVSNTGAPPVLVASADGSRLALGVGGAVYLFDPAHTDSNEAFKTVGGKITALAFSADNTKLFVAHEASDVRLATLGVQQSLTLLNDRATSDSLSIGQLVATAGGLWMGAGSGHVGTIAFAPGFDLSHSRMITPAGGGVAPVVTLDGDTMWLAGTTEIACADPQTGVIRARAPIVDDVFFDSIAPIDGRLAVTLQDTAYRISYLTPPASCG